MSNLMYAMSVPMFMKSLDNLSNLLGKAAAHAQERKFEPAALLSARLFPDMFTLTRQVQIACDFAKGSVARLCGEEPPKWEDNEASFDDLRGRIAKTRAFIESFAATRFADSDARTIEVKIRDTAHQMSGQVYLAHMVIPNFYFHMTTAYALLRHNGVDVGKRDFIGAV